uniref:Uncharacterized protein n=1 Tax=Mycena chlorophos TaxID=658473 RepID=A0ABQ0L818_MYCCL|nr:predicted protein [Mycena chlorophos]
MTTGTAKISTFKFRLPHHDRAFAFVILGTLALIVTLSPLGAFDSSPAADALRRETFSSGRGTYHWQVVFGAVSESVVHLLQSIYTAGGTAREGRPGREWVGYCEFSNAVL